MKQPNCVIGVDVGTLNARAGIFNLQGKMISSATEPIQAWYPQTDYVEESSDNIWNAIGICIRGAMKSAGMQPAAIIGISYDATCSLVALDAQNRPVSVSPTGKKEQNIIVWMDHRAIDQVNRINASGHPVLKYVGGIMSPEMEPPKMLWIKEHLPQSWNKIAKFLDLADFLTYQSTGIDTRSLCTTVCKWTYLGHQSKWDPGFFKAFGMESLLQKNIIGTNIRPMGEYIGGLTNKAANDLGLLPGIAVGVGIIDAHAGGLGVLGMTRGKTLTPAEIETNLALIGGTSTCHMAASRKPKFINGIWGPYYSAMIPGMWLTEGGQSATGALIDHVIDSHSVSVELKKFAAKSGKSIYEFLNQQVKELQQNHRCGPEITKDLHVLDYFHGNRSPRADATAKGMISGLTLEHGIEDLAKLYYATIQGIAYGTRHIVESMNQKGYRISHIHACGGGTKNPIWLQEHADITGCDIVLPKEPEAVLLGTAMLAAIAAGKYQTIPDAMAGMSQPGKVIKANPKTREYHQKKYQVYQLMYQHQLKYKQLMK